MSSSAPCAMPTATLATPKAEDRRHRDPQQRLVQARRVRESQTRPLGPDEHVVGRSGGFRCRTDPTPTRCPRSGSGRARTPPCAAGGCRRCPRCSCRTASGCARTRWRTPTGRSPGTPLCTGTAVPVGLKAPADDHVGPLGVEGVERAWEASQDRSTRRAPIITVQATDASARPSSSTPSSRPPDRRPRRRGCGAPACGSIPPRSGPRSGRGAPAAPLRSVRPAPRSSVPGHGRHRELRFRRQLRIDSSRHVRLLSRVVVPSRRQRRQRTCRGTGIARS